MISGIEQSIWETYLKNCQGVFQISCDCFVYLSAYVSPPICPSYFKLAPRGTFNIMLKLLREFEDDLSVMFVSILFKRVDLTQKKQRIMVE